MINDNRYFPETQFLIPGEAEIRRKPYRKPLLEDLGALLDLTLGGSPGVGDSGVSHSEQPPSAPKKNKLKLNGPETGDDLTYKQTKPNLKP
jgi:hypothetical protein